MAARRTSTRRAALARRAALLVGVALLLLGGLLLAVRDTSTFRVRTVRIVGLTGADAGPVREALGDAALHSTTLHVRMAPLWAAVRGYPQVAGLRVHRDLPHGLRIEVSERVPVAALAAGPRRVAVARDGTLLRGRLTTPSLPTIAVPRLPEGTRLRDGRLRPLMTLLGEAPAALTPRLGRVVHDRRGLTVQVRRGPLLVFGDPRDVQAKWAAATRVLADRAAAGASYLDVRDPVRVAAGGQPPLPAPPGPPAAAKPATASPPLGGQQ